jgi:hypothetical protein
MNSILSRPLALAASLAFALTATALDDKPDREKPQERRDGERARAGQERAAQDKVARGREEAARERAQVARDKNPAREGDRAAEPRRGEREGDRDAELLKLRARIEELAAAGKFEEAAEIKKQLAELMERRATTRDGATPEIRELQLKLKQLVADERYEEAAAVKRRLGELVEKNFDARKPDARPDAKPEARPEGRPVDGERRLQELAAMAEKLRAAGRDEDAARVQREAEDLRRQLAGGRGRGEPEARIVKVPAERGENPEARLRDLMARAEKLRAAGQLDEAEKLAREAGELRRQMAERGARGDVPLQRPEARRDARPDEYQAALKELRAEMAELHRAVAEMRKLLEEKKR